MGKLLFGVVLAGVLLAIGVPASVAQTTEDDFVGIEAPMCTGKAENGTIILNTTLTVTTCNITVQRDNSSKYMGIVFTRLDLKGNDNLTVYDGTQQVITVTGRRESLVVVVTSPKAFLVVHITADMSGSVLRATYDPNGCTIQQTVSSSRVLLSPVYLPNREAFLCNYTIGQSDDTASTALALTFTQVTLPNAKLIITSASKVINGTSIPDDVYSRGPIQMELSVQKVAKKQNFSAVLAPVTASSDCGQVMAVNGSLTFNLTVPATPQPQPFYDCRVTLSASKGKSLRLNVTTLQLVGQGDSVEIVDGGSMAGKNVLASITASTTAGYLVLSGRSKVLVRLTLGLMMGARSLNVDVKELDTVNHLYGKGKLAIPPSHGQTVVSQFYLLEATNSHVVNFMLDAEAKNKTSKYSISVYDGDQPTSPLLITFSSNRRVPVASSGKKMLVVARMSNTSQALGASFSSAAPGCDKVTSAPEGTLQLMASSKIPSMCRWTVAPASGKGTIMFDMSMVKLLKNATLSVFRGIMGSGGVKVSHLTSTSTMSSAPLPSVAVSASEWAQVVWSSGKSNLTSVAIKVRFQVQNALCGGPITAPQGHLRSPAFPNLYPLNAICTWTFRPSKPGRLLFFDFPQFQLAKNHSVTIRELESGTSRVVGSFNGSAVLPDVLYASNVTNTVTFSSQLPKSVAVTNQVAAGFDIRYWTLKCGGFVTTKNGSFSTPGYPSQIPISPTNATTLCVWFVQLPNKTGDNLNIVNLTLQFKKTGKPSLTDVVKVYDGDTLRHSLVFLNTSQGDTIRALSLYNSVIIVFNITGQKAAVDADASKLALMVNYTTFSCNKTFQCKNGKCMHPGWRCNQKDDCGDDSDEQNCVFPPPTPTPAPSSDTKKGMKPAIVALLFFVGLFLGILLVVTIPRIIRRFRTNRYSTFRDEPPVA